MDRQAETSLHDMGCMIWRARWFISVGVLLAALAGFLFLYLAVPHYKAQMIVSPANPMNGAEASALMADENFFALRFMMQRMGAGSTSDFLRFENVINGPSVAAALLKRGDVLQGLNADRTFGFEIGGQDWSPARLADYIDKRVSVEPVGASNLRRLVYYHPDPVFAALFLTALHEVSDALIRATIREEAEKRVQYLRNAIVTTQNPEHRRALTPLLLEQERLRMLVSIDTPYAAAVIEPAAASFEPEWPDKLLIMLSLVLCGALFGFALHRVFRA